MADTQPNQYDDLSDILGRPRLGGTGPMNIRDTTGKEYKNFSATPLAETGELVLPFQETQCQIFDEDEEDLVSTLQLKPTEIIQFINKGIFEDMFNFRPSDLEASLLILEGNLTRFDEFTHLIYLYDKCMQANIYNLIDPLSKTIFKCLDKIRNLFEQDELEFRWGNIYPSDLAKTLSTFYKHLNYQTDYSGPISSMQPLADYIVYQEISASNIQEILLEIQNESWTANNLMVPKDILTLVLNDAHNYRIRLDNATSATMEA